MNEARRFSTLVELLRHRAAEQPNSRGYTFLADGETEELSLTYGELEQRARAIGGWLQSGGMAGERVLMLYPPGLDFIAAFFGCLYAGAVAVPAYPPRQNRNLRRIQSILSDAQPKAALVTAGVAAKLNPALAEMPDLRGLAWLATDGEPGAGGEWSEPSAGADSLAFIQYTSGSTGTPKGVMLTHRNLLHNAAVVRAAVEHTPEDKYVSWLPTFHDMGMMAGVLQPLYSGIPVVLMSPAAFLQSPFRWLRAISEHGATTSGGPNFAYDLCAAKVSDEQLAGLDLSSWSVAFNGSEPVRSGTLARFAARFAPCGFRPGVLYPCYGLAEATLMVTGSRKGAPPVVENFETSALEKHRVLAAGAADPDARPLAGCGHPLPGQRVVVVNPETLVECRPDEVGEVWVAGESVALGYWRREEETRQTFEAYLAGTGEGPFLRTGDLGFLRGGELFITGRLKDLIIIRGLNHYPQDIELTAEQSHRALRPHCGAAFSVEVDGEERLVVVQELDPRLGPEPSREVLEAAVAAVRNAVAAAHEVQVYELAFLKPGSLPKTSSGKVQRRACRAGYLGGTLEEVFRSSSSAAFSADAVWDAGEAVTRERLLAAGADERAATLETYLREQVARFLKIPPDFDARRPLLELGLDSLSSVELKHRIETDLNISLSLDALLRGGSVESLAAEMLEQDWAGRPASQPGLDLPPAADADGEYPVSHIQQSIYFLHQLAPDGGAYNIAFAARVAADLDVEALRRAFQALSDRHPALRTTYAERGGRVVQRVHPRPQVHFTQVDAAGWSPLELQQHLDDEANRPFDLRRGPVFEVGLMSRSAREHVLLLRVHHIAIDGWSFWTLLEDLGPLYSAERAGGRATLPALAWQYADFAHWQRGLLTSPEGERLSAYWRGELGGELLTPDLTPARPRPPAQTFNGATHSFALDEVLTTQLRGLALSEGVTAYVVLLSAFQLMLHLYTGQDEILVGSPASGRSRPEFGGVVGCFMNPVGLRAEFTGATTFKSLLAQTRRKVWGAIAHQDYPSQLLADLRPHRAASRLQLFPVMFISQKSHLPAGAARAAAPGAGRLLELGDLTLEVIPLARRFARTELELEVAEGDRSIDCWFQYNTDIFDAGAVARMASHFETLLRAAVAAPEKPISHLSMLPAGERRRLLEEWSNASPKPPYHLTVVELFRQQARKTPDKGAAVERGSITTFSELDEKTARLASLIRELQR
jgi:acyl-CoA synthetase (AMP-forming)/AMP-acid ligase II/acyl carrier protein